MPAISELETENGQDSAPSMGVDVASPAVLSDEVSADIEKGDVYTAYQPRIFHMAVEHSDFEGIQGDEVLRIPQRNIVIAEKDRPIAELWVNTLNSVFGRSGQIALTDAPMQQSRMYPNGIPDGFTRVTVFNGSSIVEFPDIWNGLASTTGEYDRLINQGMSGDDAFTAIKITLDFLTTAQSPRPQ